MFITFISFFVCIVHGFVNCALPSNDTKKTFVYNTYKYNSIINVTVNDETTQVLDFIEESDQWSGYPTRVHVETSDDVDQNYPLFVTAAQQKGVSSWELPLVMPSHVVLREIGRTLCPHDSGPNVTVQSRPTLTLSTSRAKNVLVSIKLHRVDNFFVEVNKEIAMNVTPATPKYFYFSFDRDPANLTNENFFPRFNYTIPKSVLLIIHSDDEACAEVSIQNNSCPVFDNEKDIHFQGYHFTMTTKGGITVTQTMFPKGFYVVFTVKESDERCSGLRGSENRLKQFRLNVVAAVSYTEYLTGVLAALALMLLVGILGPVVSALNCRRSEDIELLVEDAPGPSTSRTEPLADANDEEDKYYDDESEPEGMLDQSLPLALTLAGLSRARPKAHDRRTNRYFWSALTVALVYALPVVQLLSTYQQMIFETGEQDVCYYNFLCALPLGPLSDFNHVFSNIGYVMLGFFFMLQVRARHRPDESKELGIPQHRGVLYSMGLALMMEGVLSACYHLCPNKMNFQFDSSFMYVTAVLTIVKLYQGRHPDVNASAHATFMLLALLMATGFIGIMYPSVYFWTIFTILHLSTCVIFTLKIYYVGRIKMEYTVFGRAWRNIRETRLRALRPAYPARAGLLAIANLANWALAIYGLYEHNKDFAKHLLAILMGNALLYTLAYVVLKLAYGEKLPVSAWIWLALAHVTWALAGYLFLSSKTKWSETPAQSRTHNAVCTALHVFDSHDVWHLASAVAMFCSFNALLVLDEPLSDVPRRLIPVF